MTPTASPSRHRVTLIPGDGIGPEVTEAARAALDATGVAIDWDVQPAGHRAFESRGQAVPEGTVESIRTNSVALKGPLSASSDGAYEAPSVALRDSLGLYVGIRPCRALPGAPTRFPGTDLVIVRMLQGDLYSGIGFAAGTAEADGVRALVRDAVGRELAADAGLSLKPISRSETVRVARATFELARARGRTTVTAVHKATVMRHTDGLFLDAAREVAGKYPDLRFEEAMIDTVCGRLVTDPSACDVLLAPMMYGDILADIGAALIGGLGMAPGANYGEGCAVFEAVHGSAPRHAGKNRANPMAAILSGAMLLRELREEDAAERLEHAVGAVVSRGETVTYDLCRDNPSAAASTSEVAAAVIAELEAAG